MIKTINVEQRHIDEGMARNIYRCPIALATKEQLIGIGYVGIDDIYDINHFIIASLPENAREWLFNFDCDESVKPFSFDIELKD